MKIDSLNDLRIASPCNVPWANMIGTDRVRHCGQCSLNVYDISQLSSREALDLVIGTEGRLCLRLHRRLDGTVITRDCPVGLRALRRRVTRRAGAVLTALLSFSAALFAQGQPDDKRSCPNLKVIKIEGPQVPDQKSSVTGVLRTDEGSVSKGTPVNLINTLTKEICSTVTDENGKFQFLNLKSGAYTLAIDGLGSNIWPLTIQAGESLRLEPILSSVVVLSGISTGVLELPLMKEKPIYENGTMKLSGDLIRRLPH
jgi:hypothetical protein